MTVLTVSRSSNATYLSVKSRQRWAAMPSSLCKKGKEGRTQRTGTFHIMFISTIIKFWTAFDEQMPIF